MTSNRRSFLRKMGAGAAGLTIGTSLGSLTSCKAGADSAKTDDEGPVLLIGDDIAIADTAYGKVR
jgi:para-nitrobenzyl esterase